MKFIKLSVSTQDGTCAGLGEDETYQLDNLTDIEELKSDYQAYLEEYTDFDPELHIVTCQIWEE